MTQEEKLQEDRSILETLVQLDSIFAEMYLLKDRFKDNQSVIQFIHNIEKESYWYGYIKPNIYVIGLSHGYTIDSEENLNDIILKLCMMFFRTLMKFLSKNNKVNVEDISMYFSFKEYIIRHKNIEVYLVFYLSDYDMNLNLDYDLCEVKIYSS